MQFEIVNGQRRNSKLLYSIDEKQLYIKKSVIRGITYYTCYKKNCKSRVDVSRDGVLTKAANFIEHNHLDEEKLFLELKAIKKIKDDVCSSGAAVGAVNALSSIRAIFRSNCEE